MMSNMKSTVNLINILKIYFFVKKITIKKICENKFTEIP